MQNVHNFEYGGLKMNPKNTIVNFLKEKLASNQDYCLIFDDVLEDYKSLCGYDLFENHGIHYENEAYYLIKSKNHPDSNLIKNCIKASDAQWHFLGILSKVDLEHIKNKNLSLEVLHNICINADIILTTAYDGEGYIFWEKNNIIS